MSLTVQKSKDKLNNIRMVVQSAQEEMIFNLNSFVNGEDIYSLYRELKSRETISTKHTLASRAPIYVAILVIIF